MNKKKRKKYENCYEFFIDSSDQSTSVNFCVGFVKQGSVGQF